MAYQMSQMSGMQKMLQDCASMCLRTYDMLLHSPDASNRARQIKLVCDCATICEICMRFMASNSILMKSICQYCAYVCEVCAKECLRHPDQQSQMCGQMCLACARDCRSMAMQVAGA